MVQVTMISDYLGYKAGQTYWVVYSIGVNMLNNGKATYVGGAGGGGGTTPVPVTVALTSGSNYAYNPVDSHSNPFNPGIVSVLNDQGIQMTGVKILTVSPWTITIPDQAGSSAFATIFFNGSYSAPVIPASKKDYTGFISLNGATNPTMTLLKNDISAPDWTRTATGTFTLTKAGTFIVGKTVPNKAESYTDLAGNLFVITPTSQDVMTLQTYAATDTTTLADLAGVSQYIHFEIYA